MTDFYDDTSFMSSLGVGLKNLGSTANADSAGGGLFNWLGNNSKGIGVAGSVIGGLGSLFDAYSGLRGLRLSEDMFDFKRDSTLTNLQNQANLTNERLATRQATRLRGQGVPEDQIEGMVNDFMAKYGVSGSIKDASSRNSNSRTYSHAGNPANVHATNAAKTRANQFAFGG